MNDGQQRSWIDRVGRDAFDFVLVVTRPGHVVLLDGAGITIERAGDQRVCQRTYLGRNVVERVAQLVDLGVERCIFALECVVFVVFIVFIELLDLVDLVDLLVVERDVGVIGQAGADLRRERLKLIALGIEERSRDGPFREKRTARDQGLEHLVELTSEMMRRNALIDELLTVEELLGKLRRIVTARFP